MITSITLKRTELSKNALGKGGVILTAELQIEGAVTYETFFVFDGKIITQCHDLNADSALEQHVCFVDAHERLKKEGP